MYIDTPYWYVWYVMWQYVWIDHMPLCPTSHILRWVTEVGFNDVLDSVVEERPCGTTVSSPGDIHWYVYTYRYIILISIFIYIYISLYTSLHVIVLLLYRVIFFRDPVMFFCAWDETQQPGWETWTLLFLPEEWYSQLSSTPDTQQLPDIASALQLIARGFRVLSALLETRLHSLRGRTWSRLEKVGTWF